MSTGALERDLAALSLVGDAEADERIAQLVAEAPDRGFERITLLLNEILQWKPDTDSPPPASIADDIDSPFELPAWAERAGGIERMQRAQSIFDAREIPSFVVLGFASLPACYRQPEIAELLGSTGRLSVQVFRRLRETADFVAAVTRPGAMTPGGQGVRWCRKVRFAHAAMRFIARLTPPERGTQSGHELQDFLLRRRFARKDPAPIDQTELAFVLQTFGYLSVRGLRTLRIRISDDEAEDMIFLWSVIGSLLGISDELLPIPDETRPDRSLLLQAKHLYEMLDRRNQGPGGVPDSGRLLTATLMVSMRSAMRKTVPRLAVLRRYFGTRGPLHWIPLPVIHWIDRRINSVISSAPRSFTRLLLGRRHAQELGVDRAPFLHFLGHQVAFALAGAFPRGGLPGAPVPRSWARSPAEFFRRGAAIGLGRRMNRWRGLPPPAFSKS